MKIFISWSGEASRKIGGVLSDWLPQVLQAVKPYYTPSAIEKGDKWLSDILSNLDKSTIGIFCMTPENLDKPWIHFEAGALAGKVDNNKVCPLLFKVTKAEVTGPLKIFQQTEFQKEDFKQLISTINKQLGEHKVSDQNLDKIFELLYPELEQQIHDILNENITDEEQEAVKRSVEDMLEELLEVTRIVNYKLSDQIETQNRQFDSDHGYPGRFIDTYANITGINPAWNKTPHFMTAAEIAAFSKITNENSNGRVQNNFKTNGNDDLNTTTDFYIKR